MSYKTCRTAAKRLMMQSPILIIVNPIYKYPVEKNMPFLVLLLIQAVKIWKLENLTNVMCSSSILQLVSHFFGKHSMFGDDSKL